MGRLFVLLGALGLLYVGARTLASLPAAARKRALDRARWVLPMFVLAGVALRARMYWLAAALAGLGLARVLGVLSRSSTADPIGGSEQSARQRGDDARSHHGHSTMTRAQAYALLGLAEGASREEIVAAHRRLVQRVHPDAGGTDLLAAQINQARDVLLGRP
jgi:DnaJ family protein C protein 19